MPPTFQKATGHTIATISAAPAVLRRRIDAGEAFDVVVLVPDQIDSLIASGKVISATRFDFARVGVCQSKKIKLCANGSFDDREIGKLVDIK